MDVKSDAEIRQGFDSDQFAVMKTAACEGMRGYMAEHKTAKNLVTGKPKKAFYAEGSGYQMGHLMGQLAEQDVRRMTTEFVDKIVLAFLAPANRPQSRGRIPNLDARHQGMVPLRLCPAPE